MRLGLSGFHAALLVLDDLNGSLADIPQNLCFLVFRTHHRGTLGVVPEKMYRIKFAACRTQAAADTFVGINHGRTALKATSGLDAHLLGRERLADIAPVMTNTLNFSARRNLSACMIVRIGIERNLAFIQLNVMALIAANGKR